MAGAKVGNEVMTGGTVSALERTFRNALLKLSFHDLYSGGHNEAIGNTKP